MKRKRLTSLLLTLAMVITMIPVFGVTAGAAGTELNGAKDVSVNSLPEKTQLKNLLTWLEFYLQYTMIDSTDDRAGSKFANADLIGAPIRAIISPKNIEKGVFEMKYSGLTNTYPEQINIDNIFEEIKNILSTEK